MIRAKKFLSRSTERYELNRSEILGEMKKLKANCRKFNSLPLSFNRVSAKTKNKELQEKCVKPNCSDLPTVIPVNFACQPTFEPTQLKTKSS